MVSYQVAELTENIGTVVSMIIMELPVVSLRLSSLTLPVSLPTSLLRVSKLPLLSNIPLPDLQAKLSGIIGAVPDNAGPLGSICFGDSLNVGGRRDSVLAGFCLMVT